MSSTEQQLIDLLWSGLRVIVVNTNEDRTLRAARLIVDEAKPLFAELKARGEIGVEAPSDGSE